MLKVKQTRYDYPYAAKPEQSHGWVLIRTDVTFGNGKVEVVRHQGKILEKFKRSPFLGVMAGPYDTADHALQVLVVGADHVATVAYAEIER